MCVSRPDEYPGRWKRPKDIEVSGHQVKMHAALKILKLRRGRTRQQKMERDGFPGPWPNEQRVGEQAKRIRRKSLFEIPFPFPSFDSPRKIPRWVLIPRFSSWITNSKLNRKKPNEKLARKKRRNMEKKISWAGKRVRSVRNVVE